LETSEGFCVFLVILKPLAMGWLGVGDVVETPEDSRGREVGRGRRRIRVRDGRSARA